jgi:hypothetical protein
MQAVIRLEERVAELHVVPTNALNKAQLALVRNYGDKAVRIKHGSDDELVIVFEAPNGNGKEKYATAEEEPHSPRVPERSRSLGAT